MSIKVSVCIPIYGVEKYIEKCARSLFEQTMRDGIEFIFVNDCTKDRCIEILEQVLAEYPHRKEQTRIIHHEKNRGLVAARNTGLAYASGEYIIHCDSDDWVELDMYEKMYLAAKENDADMVYCDYIRENPKSSEFKTGGFALTACDIQNEILSRKVQGILWNRLYRKNIALADYSEVCPDNIVFCEDLLRNLFMLNKTEKIVKVPEALYHYRVNLSSISNTKGVQLARNAFSSQRIVEKYFQEEKYLKALDYRRRYIMFLAVTYNEFAIWQHYKSCRSLRRGIWKDPNFSFLAKCTFSLACINFSAANYLYRKLKGTK